MEVKAAGRVYQAMEKRSGSERRRSRPGSGRREADDAHGDVRDEIDLSDEARAALDTSRLTDDGVEPVGE